MNFTKISKYSIFILLISNFFCISSRASTMPVIYTLDLRMTNDLASEMQYDIHHVAVCIQALVNREAPRVFILFSKQDAKLLAILHENGGLCENWSIKNVGDIFKLYDIFKDKIKGIVRACPSFR